MAEAINGEEVYLKLREFLDAMPGGFPATASGVEMRILRKLFTPGYANMVLCMTRDLESPAAIARRRGMQEEEAADMLEAMAARGLIGRVTEGGEVRYRAEQFLVGIYELQGRDIDREFSQLVEEYIPYLGLSWASIKTDQMRVVPVASAVDVTPEIATYDRVRDLVKSRGTMGVCECLCSKQQGFLGNSCRYPLEKCMVFDEDLDFYIENGFPIRRIDLEEALQLLDRSEELGLVLRPDNAQEIRFVCSCCSCCCPSLRFMKAFPNPGDLIHSNYRSTIDPDRCDTCAVCIERCPMDAIVEGEEFMEINRARCIGCGVCLSSCPQDAISLVQREDAAAPPRDWNETLHRIAVERGLE